MRSLVFSIGSLGLGVCIGTNTHAQACVVEQSDIEVLKERFAEGTNLYFKFLQDSDQTGFSSDIDLGLKFDETKNTEIGTKFSYGNPDNYAFHYIWHIRLADGCVFHPKLKASPENIKRYIAIEAPIHSTSSGYEKMQTSTTF